MFKMLQFSRLNSSGFSILDLKTKKPSVKWMVFTRRFPDLILNQVFSDIFLSICL